MNERVQRRLAAIVSADVVGYSRLMGEDQAGTLGALRSVRNDLIGPTVATHAGQIVKSMGDGWLFEFDSGSDAVLAALAIQQAVMDHELIRLRIGIHLGDIVHEDDDIYGDGVNVAARLQEQAPPKAVLISDDVQRQLDRKQAAAFLSVGEQLLKNIAQPVTTWVWPASLASEITSSMSPGGNRKPRLTVGAFEGRGANDASLADSIRDDLVVVMSSLTGFEYVVDAADADYVVQGTVRSAGAKCRVAARLLASDSNRQVWAERYELDANDPFALVDSCVYRISMSLRSQLVVREGERLVGRDVDTMSTEDLLSFAAAKFHTPDLAQWRQIPLVLERVLARDPDNFMALALAAQSIVGEYVYGYCKPDPTDLQRRFSWIDRALRRNGNSDYVHFVHSSLLGIYGEAPDEAVLAARRSLELNPNYVYGFCALSAASSYAGDYEAGIANAARMVEADNRHTLLHHFHWIGGLGQFGKADFGGAIGEFTRSHQLLTDVPATMMALATTCWNDNRREAAHGWAQRLLRREPELRLELVHFPPFRDAEVKARWVEGLRQSGIPA